MKAIFLKPALNPAFKITQPLPLLPAGFVARRARAARRFCELDSPGKTSRLMAAGRDHCATPLRHEINSQNACLVA
jgi:hypothetical protein